MIGLSSKSSSSNAHSASSRQAFFFGFFFFFVFLSAACCWSSAVPSALAAASSFDFPPLRGVAVAVEADNEAMATSLLLLLILLFDLRGVVPEAAGGSAVDALFFRGEWGIVPPAEDVEAAGRCFVGVAPAGAEIESEWQERRNASDLRRGLWGSESES